MKLGHFMFFRARISNVYVSRAISLKMKAIFMRIFH